MKKFYTTLLAALCVLGASASADHIQDLSGNKILNQKKNSLERIAPAKKSSIKQKADERFTIEGEYDIVIGDYYFNNSVGDFADSATIVNNNDGTITIKCDYFITDVNANFNEETGEITFPAVKLGKVTLSDGTYYAKFIPTMWDSQAKNIVEESPHNVAKRFSLMKILGE